MSIKRKNKRVEICVMILTSYFVMVVLWAFLATPDAALAKKPDPVLRGNAAFLDVVDDHGIVLFGSEIEGSATEVAESTYKTWFATGDVTVTLSDGTILDQKPFLIRFTDDVTGERCLVFRIGLQGGHKIRDRYSTPTPSAGIGDPDMAIPFPETTEYPGDNISWLEVVEGSVDENLDMLPGAHVILHLRVSNIPLIRMTGPGAGEMIGTISIGDMEFSFPN